MHIDERRRRSRASIMAVEAPDILEKILLGMEIKEVIRLKMVCKSWDSFISSRRFVESHLNHSYNYGCKHGHPRIILSPCWIPPINRVGTCILGSCNGLTLNCCRDDVVFLNNPMTREFNSILKASDHLPGWFGRPLSELCWGFGHDSCTDDYKVILGFTKDPVNRPWAISFRIFSLKSNVWKDIGQLNYMPCLPSFPGILCHGELYWFMIDQNYNKVILSYNLSKQEFKEIPKPDKQAGFDLGRLFCLGLTGSESLCIYQYSRPDQYDDHWVMKKTGENNISWEFLPQVEGKTSEESTSDGRIISLSNSRNLGAPIFVPSLVSPHVGGTLKRKRRN